MTTIRPCPCPDSTCLTKHKIIGLELSDPHCTVCDCWMDWDERIRFTHESFADRLGDLHPYHEGWDYCGGCAKKYTPNVVFVREEVFR